MLALAELGKGTDTIAAVMGRSPHTVRRYVQSPMFTDPKFMSLVEEYKQKELIDLTVLNIEARSRLHDLAPTMTPIEAIALMDKSFQQRRLLEGKSTENFIESQTATLGHPIMRLKWSLIRKLSSGHSIVNTESRDEGSTCRRITRS